LEKTALNPIRAAVVVASAAILAGYTPPPAGPPVILPEPGAPAPPPDPPARSAPAAAAAPTVRAEPPVAIPAGAIYVCVVGSGDRRSVTAIEFEPKVAALCAKHPEMDPCQYERDVCRRNAGRVFASDGKEITKATKAEYDRKVMRLRFQAN
jgi:anti-sigma factor RsiW